MKNTNARPFRSLADLKERNAAAELHFFDAPGVRFFSSRVSSKIYPAPHGAYFVTSERFDAEANRLYTVRFMRLDGRTGTVGEFQQYAKAAKAHREARLLAEADMRARERTATAAIRRAYAAAPALLTVADVLGGENIVARIDAALSAEPPLMDRYGDDDFEPDNGALVAFHARDYRTSGEGAIYSPEYLTSVAIRRVQA